MPQYNNTPYTDSPEHFTLVDLNFQKEKLPIHHDDLPI